MASSASSFPASGCRLHVAQIAARSAGHPVKSAPRLEHLLDLLERHAAGFDQIEDDIGVDIAAAVVVHRAALQRQAKRGIERFPVFDGADAPAAAQVAHDELQVLTFHPLLCPLGHIFDGCAVEAVAADVIVTGNLDRNGIIVRLRRHGAVERRFERADERRTG